MVYLSAKTDQFWWDKKYFGVMLTYSLTGHWRKTLNAGAKWALDNGVFSNRFRFDGWVYNLAILLPFRKTCLGVIVPDAVGDAQKTIDRFQKYYIIPKAMGYPVWHATQDGMLYEDIPWELIDGIFIGGTNVHKRGKEAAVIAAKARLENKHVHVGRVSSGYAIKKYWPWANSWDGTTFIYGKKSERVIKAQKIIKAIQLLEKQ